MADPLYLLFYFRIETLQRKFESRLRFLVDLQWSICQKLILFVQHRDQKQSRCNF